jgi:protein-tyrosine kinase
VSKFFKALEKIEHEREAREAARPAVEPSAAVATETVAEEPAVMVVAAPVAEPVTIAAPVPATKPVTVAAPVTEAPPASPFARPPAPPRRPPVYGSPIARDTSATRHAFAWQLDTPGAAAEAEIDDHLVSLLQPTSFAAEQYRTVRLAIETFRRERGTRVVAVSSPGRGDGKTTTAANLAGALAQGRDARVVLVEADLRHPIMARRLGLNSARGLSSFLLDDNLGLDAVIQQSPAIAFAVVPAGSASSMPYELLKSPRLAALFGELRERYDYVLVDAPPAVPFPDVGILRDLVDGFVMVVRANRTARETLQEAMSVLGRKSTLGVVFNDDEATGVAAGDAATTFDWRRLVPRQLGSRAA